MKAKKTCTMGNYKMLKETGNKKMERQTVPMTGIVDVTERRRPARVKASLAEMPPAQRTGTEATTPRAQGGGGPQEPAHPEGEAGGLWRRASNWSLDTESQPQTPGVWPTKAEPTSRPPPQRPPEPRGPRPQAQLRRGLQGGGGGERSRTERGGCPDPASGRLCLRLRGGRAGGRGCGPGPTRRPPPRHGSA